MRRVFPPPLRPGDRIGVIAPASAPLDPQRLSLGMQNLTARGYELVTIRKDFSPTGYLAGSDQVRSEELNTLLRRPDIRALVCVRGGYGVLRILPEIDFEAARRFPKLVIGYSDITALHFALLARAGLPALSGPMLAVEWDDPHPESERTFWDLAGRSEPVPFVPVGGSRLKTLREGSAEGILVGGNLTLITRLIGTPFLPDLDGAILYLEEVGEAPYRLDGLLAHLKLSGLMDRIGGLILGGFTESDPEPGKPSFTVEEVVRHYTAPLSCPVAAGLPYGHFREKNVLPFGIHARLDAGPTGVKLQFLEAVVQGSGNEAV